VDPFHYWGKADPRLPDSHNWHPLPYHSLDVAAMARTYLQAHPRLLRLFADRMHLAPDLTLDWLCFWHALHDLGKFATTFQNLRPDLLNRLQQRSATLAYTVRHDTLGDFLWKDSLLVRQDALGLGDERSLWRRAFAPWVAAVTGHHGQPPQARTIHRDQHFKLADEVAAADYIRQVRQLLLPDDRLARVLALGPEALEDTGRELSWWLAGLAVLSDWLGSNTAHFTYHAEPMPMSGYWTRAQTIAQTALERSGLQPCPSASPHSLAELFDWPRAGTDVLQPTPLQAWAERVEMLEGPQLYLLEDVTGAGKTEAALVLAHRLMSVGQADGVFMGLPTMATTNAMYRRIQQISPRLFKPGSRPSLTLAHGQRDLVEAYTTSILAGGVVEADGLEEADTASARCAAWLADSNKKSLLAQVGVGTIDQALLAVLHAKHQSLRLLGLFRKVLIVDEVHACDPYMQRLLECLLEFHAAAGGSAILLSATLPRHMRQALVRAYERGLGLKAVPLQAADYPLATRAGSTIPLEVHVDTRPSVRRRVEIDYLDDCAAVDAEIRAALQAGRCVCWIRNTVREAIDAWRRFSSELTSDRLSLFHARFTLGDRLRIEEEILEGFGPDSTADQRRGRLVIGTQVIEQSLDVCFDLLIGDLAPIDRLVQRAGRLQRHRRDAKGDRIDGPDQRGGARMIVYGPRWTENPDATWHSAFSRGSSFVYANTGQIWLSARLLQRGAFCMPEDARDLIEGVFGEAAQDDIPAGLRAISDQQEGRDWADTNHAHSRQLKRAQGYSCGDFGDWWSDDFGPSVEALDEWSAGAETRLGEPSCTLRFARWEGANLQPAHSQTYHAWEASSLRLPARMVGELVLSTADRAAVERTCLELPDKGKWSMLVPLIPDTHGWVFQSKDSAGRKTRWRYSSTAGLTVD
jgi:CRISPR-associated endonuclease/helicase Cas3